MDAYRLWLETVLPERLQAAQVPEEAAAIYERHLPWVVALGLEEQRASALTTAWQQARPMRDRSSVYQPRWYRSSQAAQAGAVGWGAALSTGIATAVATASQSNSGSSEGGGGFSGGGSSGGGGGGGGGGGW